MRWRLVPTPHPAAPEPSPSPRRHGPLVHFVQGGAALCGSRSVQAASPVARSVNCPACQACLALAEAQDGGTHAARG